MKRTLDRVRADARDGGFSLIELLISMVLGVLLIGGSIAIFQGNLRTASLGQAVASMQSNARFALDEMAADIRAAGYRGCASATDAIFTVSTTSAPVSATTPDTSALLGTTVAAGGLAAIDMLGYTPPSGRAAPVNGTDVLVLQYAEAPGELLLTGMDSPSDTLAINGAMDQLEVGDLALVADCSGSELFTIGARGSAAMRVELQPDDVLSRRYSVDPYTFGVNVYPFTSAMYYVGDSGRISRRGDAIRSLYLQTWPYDMTNNPPLELVEGVDQLRLSFGVRAADGQVRFVRADDAAYDASRVTSVQIGLLMTSLERFDGDSAPREFSLAGQAVGPEGGVTGAAASYPDDERLRMPFERSIAIRNRGMAERQP